MPNSTAMETSTLPDLDTINHGILKSAGALLSSLNPDLAVHGSYGPPAEPDAAHAQALSALLELRRQVLAQKCPLCKGKGMVRKYGDDDTLSPSNGSGYGNTLACPNRAFHL